MRGVRPNSPMHTITVCSSMPRRGKVVDQGREPLVEIGQQPRLESVEDALMQVPAVERDFDKGDADFDESAGHHEAAAEVVVSVGGEDVGPFFLTAKGGHLLATSSG